MIDWGMAIAGVDAIARESLLFASAGFLVGGVDDLAVDLVYGARRLWGGAALAQPRLIDALPAPSVAAPIAIFVPAWEESAVIGAMLRATLARLDHADFRLYVGTYPNDRPTTAAVAAVAEGDARVRLVIGTQPGPTTKAACLNVLWEALRRDEASGAARAKAIVLHDAEDVVHPAELRIFDALIEAHGAVQLPVLPLVDRGSQLIAGHYCDEFAEAHAKQLVVRQALGAGLPLAGVGCAIARDVLDDLADKRGGEPFDAASLTEDYEIGLQIAALGRRGPILARLREVPGGPVVAVRAYFPATLDASVRQKARWMTGIALAGWDRIGWSATLDIGEHWMRMRDRRAPVAVLVLAIAYLALVAWGIGALGHAVAGTPLPPAPVPAWLLWTNAALLCWRLAMRAVFTGAAYGAAAACWSLPRALVGNIIALLAARRAMTRYLGMLRGGAAVWDKTAHVFPDGLVAERRL